MVTYAFDRMYFGQDDVEHSISLVLSLSSFCLVVVPDHREIRLPHNMATWRYGITLSHFPVDIKLIHLRRSGSTRKPAKLVPSGAYAFPMQNLSRS
jgi:hypothetical protein